MNEKGTFVSGVDESLIGKTVGLDANDAGKTLAFICFHSLN